VAQQVKDPMPFLRGYGFDPWPYSVCYGLVLAWLWHRLAAEAQIRPVAQEFPYTTCAAVKRNRKYNHKLKIF